MTQHTFAQRTFTLSTETTDLPLVVTEDALEDFRAQGLDAMDECLERMSSRVVPANADPSALVGQMMLDGVATGNTRKLILCALWLAHHVPEATGLTSNGPKFHYVYGETDILAPNAPLQACA